MRITLNFILMKSSGGSSTGFKVGDKVMLIEPEERYRFMDGWHRLRYSGVGIVVVDNRNRGYSVVDFGGIISVIDPESITHAKQYYIKQFFDGL